MTIWQELQWDAAPTRAELHADHLAAIWAQAGATERRVILHERIAAARVRGDPRCPACTGRQRAACVNCDGSGYNEPPLRALTAMEEHVGPW